MHNDTSREKPDLVRNGTTAEEKHIPPTARDERAAVEKDRAKNSNKSDADQKSEPGDLRENFDAEQLKKFRESRKGADSLDIAPPPPGPLAR